MPAGVTKGTKPRRLTGLFLGAGASYEVGMPLVWELTGELNNLLTPARLRTLARGRDRDHSEAIEEFIRLQSRGDLHYEALLGFLETQARRRNRRQDAYQSHAWIIFQGKLRGGRGRARKPSPSLDV